VGRAFARHLAEGGEYNDARWAHIKRMAEDVDSLSGFVRATRGHQFNESVKSVITEASQYYMQIRETLRKVQSARGYHQYFESWKPQLNEDEYDASEDVLNSFTANIEDPRIERAIPVLLRLKIVVEPLKFENDLENWADQIVDTAIIGNDNLDFTRIDLDENDEEPTLRGNKEELLTLIGPDSEDLPVGPDAINVLGELEDLIDNNELTRRLRKLADKDPDEDARDTIRAWMREQEDNSVYSEIIDDLDKAKPGEYVPRVAPSKPKKIPKQPDNTLSPGGDNIDIPPPPSLPTNMASQQLAEDDELTSILRLIK
jgi:hypothetical protein